MDAAAPAAGANAVLLGPTSQSWTIGGSVRLIFPIASYTTGGQLIVSQVASSGANASFTAIVESSATSPDSGTWTQLGTAAFSPGSAWSQLSTASPATTDAFLRVTITVTSTGNMALTSLKYLSFSPGLNSSNNLPFLSDITKDVGIGVSPGQSIGAKLFVEGSTADSSSSALTVVNSGGAPIITARDDGTVGIGTSQPSQCGTTTATCVLTVNGAMTAKEVVVTSAITADYVFRPDYRLAPLNEVERFIKSEHHLPGVPSEADVRQSGVNLGAMQALLLAKIEELTLHLIRAEQDNQELKNRLTRLETGPQAGQAPPRR